MFLFGGYFHPVLELELAGNMPKLPSGGWMVVSIASLQTHWPRMCWLHALLLTPKNNKVQNCQSRLQTKATYY